MARTNLDEIISDAKTELRERAEDSGFDLDEPHDTIHEIADGAVPVYTADLLELASDRRVAQHENQLGPAFDGAPTIENIAAGAVYELVEEALHAEARLIQEEREEAEEAELADEEDNGGSDNHGGSDNQEVGGL
jgi:predicted GIY-YIG superfamily endonuclease